MGMQVEQGGGSDRGAVSGTVLSEINVTPFVDVMLVLLIIFMVTAPLLTQGIELDLPRVRGETLVEADEHPLVMEIASDGRLFLNQHEFALDEMDVKLPAIYAERENKELFIRADGAIVVSCADGFLELTDYDWVPAMAEPEAEIYLRAGNRFTT